MKQTFLPSFFALTLASSAFAGDLTLNCGFEVAPQSSNLKTIYTVSAAYKRFTGTLSDLVVSELTLSHDKIQVNDLLAKLDFVLRDQKYSPSQKYQGYIRYLISGVSNESSMKIALLMEERPADREHVKAVLQLVDEHEGYVGTIIGLCKSLEYGSRNQ